MNFISFFLGFLFGGSVVAIVLLAVALKVGIDTNEFLEQELKKYHEQEKNR